jgi:TldD protein
VWFRRVPVGRIDTAFHAQPFVRLADVAGPGRELGAEHADVRVERVASQLVDPARRGVTDALDASSAAVRVVVDGTWGLAAGDLTPEWAVVTARGASPRATSRPSGRW